jgi:hypothetical protein
MPATPSGALPRPKTGRRRRPARRGEPGQPFERKDLKPGVTTQRRMSEATGARSETSPAWAPASAAAAPRNPPSNVSRIFASRHQAPHLHEPSPPSQESEAFVKHRCVFPLPAGPARSKNTVARWTRRAAGGRGCLLCGNGFFNEVNGFLRHGTAMSRGDLPQLRVQVFGEGFNNESRHGEQKVAFCCRCASIALGRSPTPSRIPNTPPARLFSCSRINMLLSPHDSVYAPAHAAKLPGTRLRDPADAGSPRTAAVSQTSRSDVRKVERFRTGRDTVPRLFRGENRLELCAASGLAKLVNDWLICRVYYGNCNRISGKDPFR